MKFNAGEYLQKVRSQKPVVHHLTNWVTIYDCAAIVKTFGAAPVMAHAIEEVAQMTRIASALVLNIGTLTPEFVESMKVAAKSANENGIPVVLDVCGVGATLLRDNKTMELLNEVRIDVIKGNASEIARTAGEDVMTRGVDSTEVVQDMVAVAKRLANARRAVVVVTGAVDIVTDGKTVFKISNGVPMMASVVGTGCMAASVIGTFAATGGALVEACAAGLVCYEVAAEVGAQNARGPATLKEKLIDAVYSLTVETVASMQRIETV
jgi:hydroxyethylthiazole kinase